MFAKPNGIIGRNITKKQVEIGKRLLISLNSKAKKSPYEGDGKVAPLLRTAALRMSPIGEAIRLSNLLSVVIREDEQGAWYADICLKKVPCGLPNAIGSSANSLLLSKKEAHRWAYEFIRDVQFIEHLLKEGRAGLSGISGYQAKEP